MFLFGCSALRKSLGCFTNAATTIFFPFAVTRTISYILLCASFWDWGLISSQLVLILLDGIKGFKYTMNRLQLVPYFDFLLMVWFDIPMFLSLYLSLVAYLVQVHLRCPCNTNRVCISVKTSLVHAFATVLKWTFSKVPTFACTSWVYNPLLGFLFFSFLCVTTQVFSLNLLLVGFQEPFPFKIF